MSNLIKLIFSLFLGILAAGANWVWISSKTSPPEYVAAKNTLKIGRAISEEDLVGVPVPGEPEVLQKTLIPYKNRALLFGAKTARAYEAGDVFFHRDITAPSEQSEWEVIGPFRLISVGARFKEPDQASENYASDSSRNNVTIELSADFDQRTRRLLEVISPEVSNQSKKPGNDRIVAVQVVPSLGQRAAAIQPDENTVYQTVSLEGIANVPRVLLAGDRIRFVIPGTISY